MEMPLNWRLYCKAVGTPGNAFDGRSGPLFTSIGDTHRKLQCLPIQSAPEVHVIHIGAAQKRTR